MNALRLVLAALALTLAACASGPPEKEAPAPRAPADLEEAARINTELGFNYARAGDYDLALDKLERALQQAPNYAMAHTGIAYVYAHREDNEKAERHYKRALQLSPGDPSTRNNLAVFLCGQKRVDEAEKLFVQAANTPRYDEPEKAYTNAGVCVRRNGDLEKADGYFRKALELRPTNAEALRQMASLCLERKDYLRARAFLQRYEKVGPKTAATLWIGARVEFALGDEGASADYARRLKKDFPESEENLSFSNPAPPAS